MHTLTELFPPRLTPQTLTQVFGLLTYRFTMPSISPTNKNKELGLLLEALNQGPYDLLLAQTGTTLSALLINFSHRADLLTDSTS